LKNIIFHKVEMENYCGYTDPMEFTFENSKITLISGKNGVGKSTIFSAIPFSLYGVTQTGQTALDVLNNKTERNCLVKCYFSIDGIKYKAIRGIRSPKSSTSASLFIEGNRDPVAKGAREVTNKIEELIVPKELFLNTILFGQKVKSFFTELPDSKQKEIFRKILQLDAYVEYQKTASEMIKRSDFDMEETKRSIDKIDASINSSKYNIDEINVILKDKQQRYTDLENNLKNINKLKDEQNNQLLEMNEEKENDKLNVLLDKKNSLSNDLSNLNLLQDSKLSELSAQVSSKISQLKELHSSKINECNNELNIKINAMKDDQNDELYKINEELSNLREDYLTEKNDLANQHNETINEYNNFIHTKQNDLRDLQEQTVKICQSKIKNLEKRETREINILENINQNIIDDYNNEISEYEKNIVQLQKNIAIEQHKVSLAESRIEQYENSIELRSAICPTCHQKWDDVDHIEKMILLEKENINSISKSISFLESDIADLNKKIDSVNIEIQKANDVFNKNFEKKLNIYSDLKQRTQNKYDEIVHRANTEYTQLEKKYNDLKIEEENKYKTNILNLDEKFKILAKSHKDKKEKIEENNRKLYNEYEKKHHDEIDKLNDRLLNAINNVEETKKVNIQQIKNEFGEKFVIISENISAIEKDITTSKHILAGIEGFKNKIKQTENEIKYTEDQIIQCKKDIDDNLKIISNIQNKINKYVDEKDELENTITDNKKKQNIYRFWKDAFSSSGIPSMLIDESIPFMNTRISNYLEQMSNGRYIVSFDTLHETKKGEFKDKISVNVYDVETHSNSRVNFSGGQLKLVDIATILTLSDLQESVQKFKTNILLFDEIFDALDDDNIANVSNMLRRIVKDKSINIITHRHIDQVEADVVYNFGG